MLLCYCAVAGTLYGLRTELKAAIEKLTGSDRDGHITAVKSGCELFLRFITLCKLEDRVSLQFILRFNCVENTFCNFCSLI